MQKVKERILNFVRFADMDRWSANTILYKKIKSSYSMIPLFQVLKRVKEPVIIEDKRLYKRVTVRLYGNGVFMRDELYGKDIGTKKQFIAREGQLIISRIDARNGAFGIVPKELDGAIVTNDFWLFDVQNALPQYLTLVLSSDQFQQYWSSHSSGTTNRQRVDENSFLMTKIALPTLSTQKALLQKYNNFILEAIKLEDSATKIRLNSEKYIMDKLNLHCVKPIHNTNVLRFIPYRKLMNKWEWDDYSEVIEHSIKDCVYPMKTLGQTVSFINRTWKKKECSKKSFMYIEIGGINANDNTANANEILVEEAPSRATQTVESGDLIIGTTRPYLKRFAIIRDFEDGYVCSSGFQVIKKSSNYDSRYILEVLKLETTIKQFESLMTGALYPAINAEQLKQIRIPFPPVEVQVSIAEYIEQAKEESKKNNEQACALRIQAKKEFEEAVFSEA